MTGYFRLAQTVVSRAVPVVAISVGMSSFMDADDARRRGYEKRLRQQRSHHSFISSSIVLDVSHCDATTIRPTRSRGTILRDGRNFIADAVEKVLPAVVRVEVHAKGPSYPRNIDDCQSQRGSGSGFLVNTDDILPPHYVQQRHSDDTTTASIDINDADKLQRHSHAGTRSRVMVVTNAHCVLTPAEFRASKQDPLLQKRVYLELADDRLLSGNIVAFDTNLDVALIEPEAIDGTGGIESSSLSSSSSSIQNQSEPVISTASLLLSYKHGPVHMKQSSAASPSRPTVRHGEFVMAIGAPLELENTVTVGVVSNPKRKCRHSQKVYIQSDVSLHIGNSGGPLVNVDGQVIGINSEKVAEGVAYSIPIQDAVEGLQEAYFKQNKHIVHAAPPPSLVYDPSSSSVPEATKKVGKRQTNQVVHRTTETEAQVSSEFLKGTFQRNPHILISRRW
jgi:S1-C subfamily serine protease